MSSTTRTRALGADLYYGVDDFLHPALSDLIGLQSIAQGLKALGGLPSTLLPVQEIHEVLHLRKLLLGELAQRLDQSLFHALIHIEAPWCVGANPGLTGKLGFTWSANVCER